MTSSSHSTGRSNEHSTEQQIAVDINELFSFIFPKHIQHPLTAGRLFMYSLYGPLDAENNLRSGFKRSHILKDYELENMCLQFDKEDLISIFATNFQELSNEGQSAIVGQADSKFKIAKGKAMLPTLGKEDVLEILQFVPRDEDGLLNFHDIQNAINAYRKKRISNLKLVHPPLSKGTTGRLNGGAMNSANKMSGGGKINSTGGSSSGHGAGGVSTGVRTFKRDMTNIAPETMFQRMEGHSNAEIVQQTAKNLSKHAFKISSAGDKSDSNTISNVELLRDSPPRKHPGDKTTVSWNVNT